MSTDKITFRILRFKPARIDPPRFQDFSVEVQSDMTVLDGLEKIRREQDPTLMYRHSCHHSSCGTCACRINGEEKLACITKIQDGYGDAIILEPLAGFTPIGDLVVEMLPFYEDLAEDWSYLRQAEQSASGRLPEGIAQFTRFENCIECGACVSACPITHKKSGFFGPAVLAAANNELKKSPPDAEALLSLAANKRGVALCERALRCNHACPTGVYPARHIEDLRRLLGKKISFFCKIE